MINTSLFPDILSEGRLYSSGFREGITLHPLISLYLQTEDNLAVLGEGSMGKSVAARMLEMYLRIKRVPVLLVESKYINEESFPSLFSLLSENSVLIIDGLDELKPTMKKAVFELLGGRKGRTVITARTEVLSDKGYQSLIDGFTTAEVTLLSPERIKSLTGELEDPGYEELLSNTMLLSIYLSLRKSGEAVSVKNEADLILSYFIDLYSQKERGASEGLRECCERDLAALGRHFFQRVNYRKVSPPAIPKELNGIFYVRDGELYSSHLKYRSFAMAVYLYRCCEGCLEDDDRYGIQRVFTMKESQFRRMLNKYSFGSEDGERESEGIAVDWIESFFYLGQLYSKTENGKKLIKHLSDILCECGDENVEFGMDPCPDDSYYPMADAALTAYLGYNGGVLDSSAPYIDMLLGTQYLDGMSFDFSDVFFKYATEISINALYRMDPMIYTPALKRLNINCNGYYSVDNCVIDSRDGEMVMGTSECRIPSDGSVKKIGRNAFFSRLANAGNTTLIIPDGVVTLSSSFLGGYANLKELHIGRDVEFIESGAFSDTVQIGTITVSDSNPWYYVDGGALMDKRTLEAVFISVGGSIPKNALSVSPATLMRLNFEGRVRYGIPSSVTHIGCIGVAYQQIKGETVDGVTYIGNEDEPYLVAVSVSVEGERVRVSDKTRLIIAFEGRCEQLDIPDGIVSLGEHSMNHLYCERVILGASVNDIFMPLKENNGKIRDAATPFYPTFIGVGHGNNRYKNVGGALIDRKTDTLVYSNGKVIPEGIRAIGEYAFADSDIGYISIPGSVTHIGRYAFSGCRNLYSVESEFDFGIDEMDLTTVIDEGAFEYCSSLKNIDLPANLVKIGDNAFEGCSSIDSVLFYEAMTEEGLGEELFSPFCVPKRLYASDSAAQRLKRDYPEAEVYSFDSECNSTLL